MIPPTPIDRSQLSSPSAWRSSVLDLAVPSLPSGPVEMFRVAAKEALYRTSHGLTFHLALVPEPRGNTAHVIRAGQTFYLPYEGDLLGCFVGAGGFTWIKSDFKAPLTSSGEAGALKTFAAEVDDSLLEQREGRATRVDLSPGVPFQFFTARSSGSSQAALPTLTAITLEGTVLHLKLLSDGGKYNGVFSIDINSGKLLRSVVDGVEVYKAK